MSDTENKKKATPERIKYNNDKNREVYDRISVMVNKGQRDIMRQHAERMGESLNAFINRAIKNQMDADNLSI